MDSDEDGLSDDQPITCSDVELSQRFQSWLTDWPSRCRRPQVNRHLRELHLYKDSALATFADSRLSGDQGNDDEMFSDEAQNEPQHGIEIPLLSDAQHHQYAGETQMSDAHHHQYAGETQLSDAQHHQYNEAVEVTQTQEQNPNDVLHVSQTINKRSSGMVAAVNAFSRDVETQTSIVFEGLKEIISDRMTATSNLPDVIYSSSESSAAQSLPTSPDVLSNGAFKEHETGNEDPTDCEEVSNPFCSGAATDNSLSSRASDASLQRNASFASSTGIQLDDSQRSVGGKEKARKFSSGYATQSSRQSENSFNASCDDTSLVFSLPDGARDNNSNDDESFIDRTASSVLLVTGATSSLENLCSSETIVDSHDSFQATSCHGNVPDFDQLLSDEELKSIAGDHSASGNLLTEASAILGMVMAEEDENVVGEIPLRVCEPRMDALRTNEEMWSLEMMNQRLADYALLLIHEGLNPIEVERNLIERLNQMPEQNVAAEEEEEGDGAMEIWSWSDEAQRNLIGHLQIAAACGDKTCGNDRCLFFQELLDDLEEHLRNQTLLYSRLHRQILRIIVEHSDVCSEIRCTMPWCLFFHRGDSDETEEQISRLLIVYSAFDVGVTREINVTELDDVKFIQLDDATSWPSIQSKSKLVPENETDFEFLAPSAKFGRISFYARSLDIVPKLLYLEMQPAIDETHVWNRLRRLQHPNILQLLWVYVSRSQAVICSDALTYGDKSLEDVMRENRAGLQLNEFVQFSAGLLSAAEYLNRNHVLYLLWIADSVGLMGDGRTVRLRDFSCAVDESRASSDDGELTDLLSSALPPIIVSPEVFANDVGRHSDVWGIGCLMYHLSHGFTVHHDLRHSHPDHIQTKMHQLPIDSILYSIQNVSVYNLLSQVFVEKSKRLNVEQLQEQVLQLHAP